MDFHELINVFGKMGYNIFVGYYNSFLTWGIKISKKDNPEDELIRIEKSFDKEKNQFFYDVDYVKNNKCLIEKEDITTEEYIISLQEIFQNIIKINSKIKLDMDNIN